MSKPRYDISDLQQVLRILRGPEGCPWDRVQTHQSIRRDFLEEVYECCEALDTDDAALMQEELGDVLLQVVFHAQIEEDRGRFDWNDVCDGIAKKLIFRHPHVFQQDYSHTWDEMKALEKGQTTQTDKLDAVARTLPALWRAEKLSKKAAKAGAPAPDREQAADLLEQAAKALRQGPSEDAVGQVLFAAVTAAAADGVDPEMALHKACEAFIRRFSQAEQQGLDTDQTALLQA
jgi:tetrapyrrole methylase family protein/MazG family protein